MPPNPITIHQKYDPLKVETISTRPQKPLEIVPANPSWPSHFQTIHQLIQTAIGPVALRISHVGSTSVPGLPAKDVIDVDVTVADPTREELYVPALEKAGFQFLLREPGWHEHRLFGLVKPYYANIHVFGPDCPELVRHRLFRDWLREHEEDRERYVAVKRGAAEESSRNGETTNQYNDRKEWVIRDILKRVYEAHGLLGEEDK